MEGSHLLLNLIALTEVGSCEGPTLGNLAHSIKVILMRLTKSSQSRGM